MGSDQELGWTGADLEVLERQWLTRSWADHKTHLTSVRAADVADLTKIWARAGLDA